MKQVNPEEPRGKMPAPKDGDWHCTMCMNLNWARRDTCNICGMRKPGGSEEKREGRAGGHYERQEIASKARRDDSDEEYDEFGRKKKKKRRD